MPITLVTGLPGHGKTLYALARFKEIAEKEQRPVWYHGIKGLKLDWQELEDPKEWEKLPAGALLIIDEAQKIFKIQTRGNLPSYIENLSTHRHLGIDIVLITQDPMMLDTFVRRLVDRHFHVVRTFGLKRASIHEFTNGARESVSKSRKGSVRHEWSYPRKVFEWYESAEKHTVKARLPMKVWLIAGCAVVALAMAPIAYKSLTTPPVPKSQNGESSGSTATKQGQTTAPVGQRKMTAAQYVDELTPRIPGLPHTAPAYDNTTQAAHAPYPAACIASAKKCQCYTQQATRMDMDDTLCRKLADTGFFVAWNANGERIQEKPAPARTKETQ